MFNRSYGKGKPAGLFKTVRQRYDTLGLSADFLRAVGDGALWSALLAALAGVAEDAPRRFIRQAQALVADSECKELLAVATPSNLEALARASIIPAAEQAAAGRITAVRDALARVTDRLKSKEQSLFASLSRSSLQNAGSLMWSSKRGWLVVSSQQAQTYCSGYINGAPATPPQSAIDGVES
jgi:hypothetical protein